MVCGQFVCGDREMNMGKVDGRVLVPEDFDIFK